MSRSGYDEDGDFDNWGLICYRGAVSSALRGKRGQAFLREMLAALEALPNKRLIAHELAMGDDVCAIGAVGKARGIDMSKLDPEEATQVARTFGIANAMAREIVYENDERDWHGKETPEQRYERIVKWINRELIEWDAAP